MRERRAGKIDAANSRKRGRCLELDYASQWAGSTEQMTTFFDVATVTCFVGLAIVFFQFTDREIPTLVHFILAGVVFAVANQLGNGGSVMLALILIIAGMTYTFLVARR
jgi:hypothetical protein